MRCTKRDSHANQCIGIIRFNSNPHSLHSISHSDTLSTPKHTQIEGWPQSCLEDRAIAEIDFLIAPIDAILAIVVQSSSRQVIM
jgi:hypothetical protein